MAHVPAQYIKYKKVDFDSEIFSCLNLPFYIGGYSLGIWHWLFKDCRPLPLEINPPSIGVFALLEVIDSKFIKDGANSDAIDFIRALYISYYGRETALEVREWVQSGGKDKFKFEDKSTWLPWDFKLSLFSDKIHAEKISVEEIVNFRAFLIENTFNGYEMIPDSGQGTYLPYLFGAETLASVSMLAGKLNIPYEDVIWNVPLCLCGHIAACEAKRNGVKGVERPKDKEDIKLQFKLANEREARGELHPWQIAEPDNANFALSEKQIQARPEIKKEFTAILKAHLRAKRAKAQEVKHA